MDVKKRFKNVSNATSIIRNLLTVAEKQFRKLEAFELLKDVDEGEKVR